MKLTQLKNKNILILGFGREGKDSYKAIRKMFPDKSLSIADRKNKLEDPRARRDGNVSFYLGRNYLDAIKKHDLIIRTPGIPLSAIQSRLDENKELTSQTQLFLDNCPGQVIGITGTKGKGTCSSLIYYILKSGGVKVNLVGNIGTPVLQTLLESSKKEVFVYEISSHQLQDLRVSPHIGVLLNIYPAHLDYFKDFEQYKSSKEKIAIYQKPEDFLIYNKDQQLVKEIAGRSKAKKIPFGYQHLEEVEKIISKDEIPLKGKFNLLNILAAKRVGEIFNISEEKIKEGIKSFVPLPHRLEFVGKYKGIEFYNDSLATIPESTIAAIEGLNKKIDTLIVGGYDTGVDYFNLSKKIVNSDINNIILFPTTGEKILEEIQHLKPKSSLSVFIVSSMKEAVETAYNCTSPGICLLSPASPSFNLFKDYKERGELFKKWVRKQISN